MNLTTPSHFCSLQQCVDNKVSSCPCIGCRVAAEEEEDSQIADTRRRGGNEPLLVVVLVLAER